PEVGAGCPNGARPVLCGGCAVMRIPTATSTHDVDPIPSRALSPGREGDAAGASASCIPLALSLRTEVGRSSGLNDAAHLAAAIATRTRIAFVAIDRPAVLEIAELAISLNVVAERRSTGLDGLGQNRS